MSSEAIKGIRTSVFTLIIVLVFAVLLQGERNAMYRDLIEVERYSIAAFLMKLPASPIEAPVVDESITDFLNMASNAFQENPDSEIAMLGQFQLDKDWTLQRKSKMPEGIEIQYTARRLDENDEEMLSKHFIGVLKNCDDLNKSNSDEDISTAKNGRYESSFVNNDHQHKRVFFIDLDVSGDLYIGSRKLIFSNLYFDYEYSQEEACYRGGEPVLITQADGYNKYEYDDIVAIVGRITSQWGIAGNKPEVRYVAMKRKYERQRVKIPVLSSETYYPVALILTTLMSIGALAWSSSLFRTVEKSYRYGNSRPWILMDPVVQWCDDVVVQVILVLELILFWSFYALAYLTPAYLIWLIYRLDVSAYGFWLTIGCWMLTAVYAAFIGSIGRSFIKIIRARKNRGT